MDFFTSGLNPWRQAIPMHASWDLLWISLIAGLAFMFVHAVYSRGMARRRVESRVSDDVHIPQQVPRHSFAARAFHWVMAGAMFVLLLTGFLPVLGVEFAWVRIHWIAGLILAASFLFHVVHTTLWLDFWSIWPDRQDLVDARTRIARTLGKAVTPRKAGKYPLENKLYHLTLVATGLVVTITGGLMMVRVETPFWTRNPYLLGDWWWGVVYVAHGLSGISLIALVIVHVYFAVRPDKWAITRSMIVGTMDREHYLQHHDPERWKVIPTRGKPVA